jgi:ABC-type branched-subunit amino acid transport system substrate-binding protein
MNRTQWTLLICLLIACVLPLIVAQPEPVVIGGSLSLSGVSPNNGKEFFRVIYGGKLKRGYEFAVKKINDFHNGGIPLGNKTVQLTLGILDDKANTTLLANNYKQLVNDSNVNFILGPVLSDYSVIALKITEAASRWILGTATSIQDFYFTTQRAISIVTANVNVLKVALLELRVKKAKSAVVLLSNGLDKKLYTQGIVDNAPDAGIDILAQLHIEASPFSGGVISEVMIQNLTAVAQIVKDMNPDAVFYCETVTSAVHLMTAFKDLNWTPGAVIIASATQTDFPTFGTTNATEVMDFVTSTTTIVDDAEIPGDRIFGSWSNFREQFYNQYGTVPGESEAYGAVAVMALYEGMINSNSTAEEKVFAAMLRYPFQSFFGKINWAADRSQAREPLLVQAQPLSDDSGLNSLALIGPRSLQQFDMVYPMPSWEERVFAPQITIIEAVIFALTAAAMALSIAWAIYTAVNWRHKIIRSSSPSFLVIMVVGALLSFATIYVWNLTYVSVATCILRVWFLNIGFVLMFGALFAKTWRIYFLWTADPLNKNLRVTDVQVFLVVLVALAPQLILLVLWTAIATPTVEFFHTDPWRASLDIPDCSTSTAHYVMIALMCGINFALLIWGSILAIQVRRVPLKVYDESKIIGFAIYNTLIFSIIVAIIQASGQINRDLLFGLRSVGILLACLVSLSTMYYSKIQHIRRYDSGDTTMTTNPSIAMTNSSENNTGTTHSQK